MPFTRRELEQLAVHAVAVREGRPREFLVLLHRLAGDVALPLAVLERVLQLLDRVRDQRLDDRVPPRLRARERGRRRGRLRGVLLGFFHRGERGGGGGFLRGFRLSLRALAMSRLRRRVPLPALLAYSPLHLVRLRHDAAVFEPGHDRLKVRERNLIELLRRPRLLDDFDRRRRVPGAAGGASPPSRAGLRGLLLRALRRAARALLLRFLRFLAFLLFFAFAFTLFPRGFLLLLLQLPPHFVRLAFLLGQLAPPRGVRARARARRGGGPPCPRRARARASIIAAQQLRDFPVLVREIVLVEQLDVVAVDVAHLLIDVRGARSAFLELRRGAAHAPGLNDHGVG